MRDGGVDGHAGEKQSFILKSEVALIGCQAGIKPSPSRREFQAMQTSFLFYISQIVVYTQRVPSPYTSWEKVVSFMAKQKGFPQTLYVKRENEGTNEEYLNTETDIEALAEVGEAPIVAEYRLVRTDKLCTVVDWPKA